MKFGSFYPDEYRDSAYIIDYEELYKKGYRGIIYDIDNTLVRHGYPADDRAIALFKRLHSIGFKTITLSNNKEPRVKMFCDAADTPYIYKAGKPGVKGYMDSMRLMGTDSSNTLFIGDQIFTDVWGANRAGIHTILVKPIHPKEEIQIVLKRILERPILFFYLRKQKEAKNCIILIGFMGAGKTTVGRILAGMMGIDFIDTDTEIQNKCNMTIPEMFDNYGESYFREAEKSLIQSLNPTVLTVISCGGGCVADSENLRKLKELGKIIYLRADADTIEARLSNDSVRPLLMGNINERSEKIRKLLGKREDMYKAACDICVDTDGLSAFDVADYIKKLLKY